MNTIKFSPQTGATRLFRSYNLAQEWFPNAFLIVRPKQFLETPNHLREPIPLINQYWAMFSWAESRDSFTVLDEHTYITKNSTKPFTHPRSAHQLDNLEDVLWDLAFTIGNWVYRPPGQSLVSSPQQVLKQGFQVDLEAAKRFLNEKAPKQAKVIAQCLVNNAYDFYTEQEMRQALLEMVAQRQLKTTQDSWRILRYYRPLLAQHGVLVYHETTTPATL